MQAYERLTQNEISREDAVDVRKLIGQRVLTKRGFNIGRVSEMRINPKTCALEGVFISRGLFRKPVYIGTSYFDRISEKAIILKIEPSILLKGKNVISAEGKKLGRIREIMRKGDTNEIEEITVHSFFKGDTKIKPSEIATIGASDILKHNAPKKYIPSGS